MNVLYSPRMPENTAGGWLECVLRPWYRYKKLSKPRSWPINLNLCPSSWLDYRHGLHIPQPLSLPISISQASGMAYIYIYKQTCESL